MNFLVDLITGSKEYRYLTKIIAALMVVFQLIGSYLFGLPQPAVGETLDLGKFTLVWSDEFEGNAIDSTKWKDHHPGPHATIRRGGWTHSSLAEVKDGSLHIYTKYLENGAGGGQPGYYSYLMDTKGLYEQTYGYFEIRCRLPKGDGHWAAFWMLTDGMSNVDSSGRDGAEIDIFEAPNFYKKGKKKNSICSNIHYDGYGEGHESKGIGDFYVSGDPYSEFNTYGVEWNENEYIFYINGVETDRMDFGGASQVPEYLLLSVEIGGENGQPGDSWAGDIRNNTYLASDFEVDYVRAYQYKDKM